MTVQVPVLETDDSKTSLSSRVVPALVDIARSGERGVATARASLAKARFVVVGGLLIPGSPTHRGKDPDAVACAAVAVDLALPAERVQCYGNGTDVAERVGWCSPSRMTRPTRRARSRPRASRLVPGRRRRRRCLLAVRGGASRRASRG